MVDSLPKELQSSLEGLIQDNTLCSWTIQGNLRMTSLTIRFTMESGTVEKQDKTNLKYKKVPSSQLDRDMKRAEQWREQSLPVDTPVIKKLHDDTPNIIRKETPTSVHPPATITNLSPPHTNTRSKARSHSAKASILTPSPIPQVDGTIDREVVKPSSSPSTSQSHIHMLEHCESLLASSAFLKNDLLELQAMCREGKVKAGVEEGPSGFG